MNKLNSNGFSVVEVVLLAVLIGLVAGIGLYVISSNDDRSEIHQNTTDTVSLDANTEDEFSIFNSKNKNLTFEYPSSWSKEEKTIHGSGELVTFTNVDGKTFEWRSMVDGLGGGCSEDTPKNYIRQVTAVPGVKDGYVVEVGTKDKTTAVALVNEINNKKPIVGETESCLTYLLYAYGEELMALGTDLQVGLDSLSEARVAEVKSVILSAKLQD